jgi:hypothetical protein
MNTLVALLTQAPMSEPSAMDSDARVVDAVAGDDAQRQPRLVRARLHTNKAKPGCQ